MNDYVAAALFVTVAGIAWLLLLWWWIDDTIKLERFIDEGMHDD